MANSVGVILVEEAEIGKIVLTPEPGIINHRVNKDTITVHYSDNNFDYHEVAKEDWTFEKDEEGRVTIIFKEAISAVAFKVHSNHDDRDLNNAYVDLSTFNNSLDHIIRVYQRSDEGKIEYSYDAGGNRTERHTIVVNDDTTKYEYYQDSNRLKKASYIVGGESYKEWYYIYDENGNLVAKGNEVMENADGIVTLVKDSESSIYWEYKYTADNRLKAVSYMGEIQAEYSYDTDGKRIIYDTGEGTTYFVFNFAAKAIFEENVTTSEDSTTTIMQTSFIYALSKQIARVEGVIGGDGEVIYYHHDNLGSTRMMTDESGEVVFDQDYLPFGGDLAVVGDLEPVDDVGEGYKYTGQRQESSIGLYYYGARFYDPELGRFITEDTYQGELADPQSQNIYVYVLNNPMKYVDPTGHWNEDSDWWNPFTWFDKPKEYNFEIDDISAQKDRIWDEISGSDDITPDYNTFMTQEDYQEFYDTQGYSSVLYNMNNFLHNESLLVNLLDAALGTNIITGKPVANRTKSLEKGLEQIVSGLIGLNVGDIDVVGNVNLLPEGINVGVANDSIRAYRGIDINKIPMEYRADSRLLTEMNFKGKGLSGTNAAGWERNAVKHFAELLYSSPQYWSDANIAKIENGVTPIVDRNFVKHFPQYKNQIGDKLIHHHIGGGGQAVAVPQSLHPGFGGIHNYERDFGIRGNDPFTGIGQVFTGSN